MLSRRSMLATPLVVLGSRAGFAAEHAMTLCMHTNTSSGAGYRAALEGWAKAGIKNVELNATLVEAFIRTDSLEGARKVLTDNGLTAVHGAVSVNGLLEPGAGHAAAVDTLKKRLDLFAFLGVNKVYATPTPAQKIERDDYTVVVEQ